jgi:hypothetical protein
MLGRLSRFGGFQVWSWGLALFGIAAVLVLLVTAIEPNLLSPTS